MYLNLSKQVKKLCLNGLYCYSPTKKTISVHDLCLKFVKFYIYKILSLTRSQKSSKILTKNYLFVHKKFCYDIFSDVLLYNADKSISFT